MFMKFSYSISTSTKIFRFENFWLENVDCIDAIKNAFCFQPHSSPMHGFYHIIARIRAQINSIKHYSLGSLERDIKNLEVHIQALDVNDLNNALIDLQIDRSLHNNYRALLRQHHNRCTQTSRLNWISGGDMTSSFFHKITRISLLKL